MARADRQQTIMPSLLGPADELRFGRVASVAVLKPVDRLYNYLVPDELAAAALPGVRVSVPFGPRERPTVGFCVSVSEAPWQTSLKGILRVIDPRPLLSPKLLELGQWIARYYAAPLGHTLHLMIPAAARETAGGRKVRWGVLTDSADTVTTEAEATALSAKQGAVLAALAEHGGELPLTDCCRLARCGPGVIKALVEKGRLRVEFRAAPSAPLVDTALPPEPKFTLTEEQQAAIASLNNAVMQRQFAVQVLFGVTGSGKTECYVAAMRQALVLERQAMLLVPEIALTTQTVQRLQARFPRVATIHSGLSDTQRSRAWAAIASGDVPVVIGTRSAIFAPCPNLGVIIVDEEAEGSYKNLAAPRYHTRDVAIQRGRLEGIPVVLGSATPSLETWKNAREKKHYHLLRLPHRVRGLAMPTVHLVDMHQEHGARRGMHLLSRAMEWHLRRTLDRGEQGVLLLNRRGYASYLHCPRCQTVITCPHCSLHMVFHATTNLAHCHYCHQKVPMPSRCPTAGCGGSLVRFGIGTQRVEAELYEKFPEARLRRMDSDVMQRLADYADTLAAFERREFDILVGTQMIAKGLDFPFVSFVGVISADTALGLDDFRSEERTFQLVLQVTGRSGRGDVGGHVVVQTFSADASPIRHAVEGDYESFAREELARRQAARLPPCTRMVRVVLADAKASRIEAEAEKLAARLRETLQKAGVAGEVLGPQPAAIPRLRDQYRHDLQVILPDGRAVLAAVDAWRAAGVLRARVGSVMVDVDPVSLQ